MFEGIQEKFNMEPTGVVTKPFVPRIESFEEDTIVTTKDQIQQDADDARKAIKHILGIGVSAVEDLANIARTAETARSYEVLAQLIKTISDTSKDLLDIHKTKTDIDKKTGNAAAKVVNNNVFVGSTNDLMQMLKNHTELPENP